MTAERVAIIGSGAGGMAVASAIADGGAEVLVGDLPDFRDQLDAIDEQGGISRRLQDSAESRLVPVAGTATDLPALVTEAPTVVVVAPLLGHPRLLGALRHALGNIERLLFIGEGGGALRARALVGGNLGSVAESNTLPYLARIEGPAHVMVRPKQGGVFVGAVPVSDTKQWVQWTQRFWPWVAAARDVFDTVIANYNVVDHVPTVLANAGYLEAGTGKWPLWGEGCTPAVAQAIDALDGELQQLRDRLGLPPRRYTECLVAQGFATQVGATVHDTIRSSVLNDLAVERDPHFLQSRFIMEDVPHALALIESIGRAHAIDLPLASALITFASMLVDQDLRATGTTLQTLGLPEDADELDRMLRR